MIKRTLLVSALATVFIFSSGYTLAEDQQQVYGSQLMTQQERMEFRQRMRAAKSDGERQQIRKEHHQRMQEKAKAEGVTLPDEPPARGRGMGAGGGMKPGGGSGR